LFDLKPFLRPDPQFSRCAARSCSQGWPSLRRDGKLRPWQAMPWRRRARRESWGFGPKGRAMSSKTSWSWTGPWWIMRTTPHHLVSGRAGCPYP